MNERTRLTLAARPAPAEDEATAADKTRAWQVSPARAEKLKEQHKITIDKKKILLDGPMKQTGTFSVDVKLYPEVSGKLTVDWFSKVKVFNNCIGS